MHLCPECGCLCGCDCEAETFYDSFDECLHHLRDDCIPLDPDETPTTDGWMCTTCQRFQPDKFHCEGCGADPPWGPCECPLCDDIHDAGPMVGLGGEA
jgi:hypothetical protein